jgi:hypothetical protein
MTWLRALAWLRPMEGGGAAWGDSTMTDSLIHRGRIRACLGPRRRTFVYHNNGDGTFTSVMWEVRIEMGTTVTDALGWTMTMTASSICSSRAATAG